MSADTIPLRTTKADKAQHAVSDATVQRIPIDLLQPGRYQPRRNFSPGALAELTRSIATEGVIQPILVRPLGGTQPQRYEIIAGERRWRAAQAAGLEHVPAIVRDTDDRSTLVQALVENIQREDLNPVETARAVQRLIDEFGLTQQEAAERVGYSRESVSHLLRVLSLAPPVLALLEKGELSLAHAKCLVTLPECQQTQLARRAVNDTLSARALARRVRSATARNTAEPAPAKRDPDLVRLETRVGELLGAATRVEYDAEHRRGKLSLSFHSLDALQGILERFGYRED